MMDIIHRQLSVVVTYIFWYLLIKLHFRTVWRRWAKTSIQNVSPVLIAAKSLRIHLSILRTDFLTAKKAKIYQNHRRKFNGSNHCRLERVVHNKVHLLRIPDRGRRQMGGGPQQQLSLTMLQLHGKNTALQILDWNEPGPSFNCCKYNKFWKIFERFFESIFIHVSFTAALQGKYGGQKLLCEGRTDFLQKSRHKALR